MKILVLGATGMLGHKVYQIFKKSNHELYVTTRKNVDKYDFFNEEDIINNFDVADFPNVKKIITNLEPDVIINCIGIIKSLAKDYVNSIYVNSLFPHKIAKICIMINSKLIHISTDCVFSGKKGDYKESDFADSTDLYGRSKLLGEVTYDDYLTIRTSIIGRELGTKNNLIEWFLSQHEKANGFVNAIWSGLTTIQLSRVLLELIEKYPKISGLSHISGEKINKFDLLNLFNKYSNKDLKISKYEDFYCDRSLKSDKFPKLKIKIPSIENMVKEMFSTEENNLYRAI